MGFRVSPVFQNKCGMRHGNGDPVPMRQALQIQVIGRYDIGTRLCFIYDTKTVSRKMFMPCYGLSASFEIR